MVRMLLVVVLVGKLLLVGWLVGLWPAPDGLSEAWSRTQRAVDVLRGKDSSDGPMRQALEFCRLLEDPGYRAGEMSEQQTRRHWEAVVAAAPGHLRHETLTLYAFESRLRLADPREDPAILSWPLSVQSASRSLGAGAVLLCGW